MINVYDTYRFVPFVFYLGFLRTDIFIFICVRFISCLSTNTIHTILKYV